MDMTVKQMLGQQLVFGFRGHEMSEGFKSLIREYQIGNVILFQRNVKRADRLRSPYGLPLLPDCACKIAAYDYSAPSFIALKESFRGGAMTGVFPAAL